jgi:hypothetical protein
MLKNIFSKGRGRIRMQIGPSVSLSKDTQETMQNETANLFMTNSVHLRSHSMISDGDNHTILLPQDQAGF